MIPPRAFVFIGLNAVRVLSIIGLLLVLASSIFVMVNDIKAFNAFQTARQSGQVLEEHLLNCDYIEGSTVPNQAAGIFWAVVSRMLLIFEVVILLMSEISWPLEFFDNYFPVLGTSFGLGALGIFECLIGAQILSHHVDDFTLVAAFFLFAVGCVNMLLGLIFRESAKAKRSITTWRAESQGILPTHKDNRPVFVNASPQFVQHMFTGSTEKSFQSQMTGFSRSDSRKGLGFGRQGEKAAEARGYVLPKPAETLPRYAARTPSVRSSRASVASQESPVHSSPPPTFKSSQTAI